MDLMQFHADAFCRSCALLLQVYTVLDEVSRSGGRRSPADHVWGVFGQAIGDLQRECALIELPMSLAALSRVRAMINDPPHGSLSYLEFIGPIRDLHTRVVDELGSRLFLAVPPQRTEMYQKPGESWADVPNRFPGAVADIEEASKCMALGCYTAAVFHLMRVLETALAAIGKALGITSHSPTWNAYLVAFRSAIDARYPEKDKSAQNQKMRSFYAGAEAQLRTVKDAWRNPTMHRVETIYTDMTALDVYSAVRAFMRVLATELRGA